MLSISCRGWAIPGPQRPRSGLSKVAAATNDPDSGPIAGTAMSATGLDVFDKTLQTTHIWLDEIIEDLATDRQTAWHVLGAVLRSLRDRLPAELSAHVSAELPLLVRGSYFDGWRPGRENLKSRSLADFLERVSD